MKRYYKEGNGKRVWFNGVLKSNGMQVINPSEEQIFSEGWTEYVPPVVPEPTEEELLEQARERKLSELHAFDESKEVNNCIIVYKGQEIDYWAKPSERTDLKNAIRDCIAIGREKYRLDLRDKGISVVIPCESLLMMLAQLEVYAIDCFNRTTDHEFFIKSLTTRDEIEAYEFRGNGYPQQLRLEL